MSSDAPIRPGHREPRLGGLHGHALRHAKVVALGDATGQLGHLDGEPANLKERIDHAEAGNLGDCAPVGGGVEDPAFLTAALATIAKARGIALGLRVHGSAAQS
jgi:hypothetical protein